MSRELPILFNTDMVQALLDGRKNTTRRVIKFPQNRFTGEIPRADNVKVYENTLLSDRISFHEDPHYSFDIKPPYQRGDILYVRETWFYEHHMEDRTAEEPNLPSGNYSHRYIYKADDPDYPVDVGVGANGWHPSIHMPKEAARIWLMVKNIRVERLQNMGKMDAVKEGIDPRCCVNLAHALTKFKKLWNSTIKKSDQDLYGWEADPWVWVIEFERYVKSETR
jgi:hypothetical protein